MTCPSQIPAPLPGRNFGLIMPPGCLGVRMHGIDLGGGGGGRVPCPVPSENLLIRCSEIMTYSETCQGNIQMVPIKLF